MAGKGSRYRPVDRKKYNENYDRIFRKDKEQKDIEQVKPQNNEYKKE